MFDLNVSDFQYDLEDCLLCDKRTGKQLGTFNARDLTEAEIRSGYVAGVNIGRALQSRLIAVSADLEFTTNCNVYIDGDEYGVAAIRKWKNRKLGEELLASTPEIVLELN